MRGLAALSAAAWLSAAAIGCGSGLSKADADQRCNAEKMDLSSFFDDKVFAQCEQCYESCGDDCVRHATSPISYSCASASTTSTGTGP